MTATPPATANVITADGIAGLLPSLPDAQTLSAVDTVGLAASLRELATVYAWEGAPPQDIDAVCELRRKLHTLGSVLFGRRDELPPDALIDVDTAARLVERAAVGVIRRAQSDGTIAKGSAVLERMLTPHGRDLHRLHTEHDWSGFAEALDECRAAGDVSITALRNRLDGTTPVAQPNTPETPALVLPRSLDEVRRTVRGIITDVRGAASAAESLTVADVDTLEPAESADLARELWDQMVITTRAYAALHGRGRQRRSA
jgi:hypothetical protein